MANGGVMAVALMAVAALGRWPFLTEVAHGNAAR